MIPTTTRLGRLGGLLACIVGTMVAGANATADDDSPLSSAVIESIRTEWAPAYESGHPAEAARLIRLHLGRLDRSQIEHANLILAELALPPVDQILVESQLPAILGQGAASTSIRNPVELVQTLQGLARTIDRIADQVEGHAVMRDRLTAPQQFDEYEQLFWEVHVMHNLLTNAVQIASHADDLSTRSAPRIRRDGLHREDRQVLQIDFRERGTQLASMQRELQERAIELRIYRLEDAHETLAVSDNPRDRLLSAFVVDSEGHQLARFFASAGEQGTTAFQREGLNDQRLEAMIDELVGDVRKSEPDTVHKARLLFAALHWWMRGRYGAGPEYYGLLKSPIVMADASARFPLFMPIQRPRPGDPYDGQESVVPQFDRRHHYIWSYQDRDIRIEARQTRLGGSTETELLDVNKSSEPVFW